MDNPGDAKYGMTTEQLFEAFKIMKSKGVEEFGIHAFLASNTVTNEYYPTLAKTLFEVAVKLKEETGAHSRCIPFAQEHLADTCPVCGKKADKMVVWGRQY